jgi:hypothetical protein
MRVPFAAAGAIAAYLSMYLLAGSSAAATLQAQLQGSGGGGGSSGGGGSAAAAASSSSSSGSWCQQVAVPPMGLVSPDKLAALLRLFKYRLGGSGPPAAEALEGLGCRCGRVRGAM